jgi:hypothetical protein
MSIDQERFLNPHLERIWSASPYILSFGQRTKVAET